MEELRRLIDVLEKYNGADGPNREYVSELTNLDGRLYQLAKDNNAEHEGEIIKQLYGTHKKVAAFRMLKSRLKKKLYNQVLFVDIQDLPFTLDTKSAELECQKDLYVINILRATGDEKLALMHLQKVLSLAQEMQFIKVQIEVYETQRILYAADGYSRKKFSECVEKLDELYKLRNVEENADKIYYKIRFNLKLGVEENKKHQAELGSLVEELHNLWQESGLNSVFRRYHKFKLFQLEGSGDAAELIEYLRYTFKLYEQGKIHKAYYSVTFNKFMLVYAYLRNQDYKTGLEEAEKLAQVMEVGSRNWFAHLENYFLLAVHDKDYKKAEGLLLEVFENKYFQDNNLFSQERWSMYYLVYHFISGFTIPVKLIKKLQVVPQDKKGFNLWRLILDFMLALQDKEPEAIGRETERVKKFMTKYLVNKEDARSKYFLKLLLLAGREYDDTKICRKKGEYLFDKLKQAPIPGYAYAETEIVPYEDLWEILLQKLETAK